MESNDIPQADSLPRLRSVLKVIADEPGISARRAGEQVGLSDRHADYYAAAGTTLGLLREVGDGYEVTERATELLNTPEGTAKEALAWRQLVKECEVVQVIAPDLFASPAPTKDVLARRIQAHSDLSEATAKRRAGTLLRWRAQGLERDMPLFDRLATGTHRSSQQRDRQQGASGTPNSALMNSQASATHSEPDTESTSIEESGNSEGEVDREGRLSTPEVPTGTKPFDRLTKLVLEGFKGFKEATLDIGNFTVIVGTNAGGKSNLRDAFRFLHGIARGYTLAEIIGEKWVEGGVLQWRGIRGGTREATYTGQGHFALQVEMEIVEGKRRRTATYRIKVEVPTDGRPPRVLEERLVVEGRGQFVFDSHPEKNPPSQDDPLHLWVRLKKGPSRGFVGRQVQLISNRPAITQILEHRDVKPKDVRDLTELVLGTFRSMRFLDLSPDAMRLPSLPGQVILGDRGENLSSVLQAICESPKSKNALVQWIRELTPLDVVDFKFPADQTGRILATLVEEGGHETSAYSASDGTLRFLAMIAAFLGPDPAHCYFFEELETGLHPTRLHLLLSLIEKQAERGVSQVVATTHSPQLLTFLNKKTVETATLAYRLPHGRDQRLRRIVTIRGARRVLETQDIAQLHASGWLEDAVELLEDAEEPPEHEGESPEVSGEPPEDDGELMSTIKAFEEHSQ